MPTRPKPNSVEMGKRGDVMVISLPRELGADLEEPLKIAVDRIHAESAIAVVLDFSSVFFTNTAGIGALAGFLREMIESKVPVSVAGASGQPKSIMDRVGFTRYARVDDSIDAAIENGFGS